jgi:hypothetical protein
MGRAKLASGKKTEPTETKHRRVPGSKTERKGKAEKLMCLTDEVQRFVAERAKQAA